MNTLAVRFDNVTKKYPLYHHLASGIKNFFFNLPANMKGLKSNQYLALNRVTFEIKKGETVGIIGRNGAGKSTTLGLIAQVLRPTSGIVEVFGRVSPLLELGGGFHPDLNGIENIHLNGVLMGLSRKQVQERMADIVAFSELGEFIDQPVRTYSTGMLARLGFSVAASLDPEILLIDEVLAVGDARFQSKCLEKIRDFKRNGVTIVLVSHSAADIEKVCDRVIWIDQKQVREDGETRRVLEEYQKEMLPIA